MKAYGTSILWGNAPVKPFSPPLEGKVRIRMRAKEIPTVFVKDASGIRRFCILDNGETWSLGPQLGENRRVEERTWQPSTAKTSAFLAVMRIGNLYRSPRTLAEAVGWKVDEVWFFGDANHVAADKKICDALTAAACASRAPIYWMPLPRQRNAHPTE